MSKIAGAKHRLYVALLAFMFVAIAIGALWQNTTAYWQAVLSGGGAQASVTPNVGHPESLGREEGIARGARAPDFSLSDLDGRIVTLSQYRGQPVLLFFWATW